MLCDCCAKVLCEGVVKVAASVGWSFGKVCSQTARTIFFQGRRKHSIEFGLFPVFLLRRATHTHTHTHTRAHTQPCTRSILAVTGCLWSCASASGGPPGGPLRAGRDWPLRTSGPSAPRAQRPAVAGKSTLVIDSALLSLVHARWWWCWALG